MTAERESFIGIWDVYAGPTHSELMLHPDGSYVHALWGGVQSHWGAWSLQEMGGHPVLVMELRGAQPMVFNGPYGPTPMQWPATEQYAVVAMQPNQVNFYGSLMVRRSIDAQQRAPSMEVGPQQMAMPQAPPPVTAPQPTAPAPPRVDLSVLAAYSAPPPPPPPDPHNADVLKQWQSLTLENLMAQGQTNVDIFNAQQQMNTMQLEASITATQRRQAMFHKQNDRFLDMLRG